jgi:hypothetical protein
LDFVSVASPRIASVISGDTVQPHRLDVQHPTAPRLHSIRRSLPAVFERGVASSVTPPHPNPQRRPSCRRGTVEPMSSAIRHPGFIRQHGECILEHSWVSVK